MADETQEICACRIYEPGEESGMVVCWICEQPIAEADPLSANVAGVLQREVHELRQLLDEFDIYASTPPTAYNGSPFMQKVREKLKRGLAPTVSAELLATNQNQQGGSGS